MVLQIFSSQVKRNKWDGFAVASVRILLGRETPEI